MKKLVFVFVVAFAFCTMAMASDIAFYVGQWNTDGWYDASQFEDVATIIALTGKLFKDIQQFDDDHLDEFGAWVDENTNDGEMDIIWLNGCTPSCLYPNPNVQPDGSRAEKWLDGGNMIINVGDWFAYCTYEGGARGSDNGGTGAANILDLSSGIISGGGQGQMTVTPTGKEYLPSLNSVTSDRPVLLSAVVAPWEVAAIFAQNTAGTYADPVVLHNTQTGGYLAIINQGSSGNWIADRGLTCAEFIGNWVNKVIGLRKPEAAGDPNPKDEVVDVPRDVVLSWTPGIYADKHDVYFGTNFNDVNDASRTNPRNVLASQNQGANTYDRALLLEFGQTYYWRVDEVNAPPDYTIYKGDVWSFKAETFAYPIENIIATASSSQMEIWGPQNTVNGSGLDAHDLHSTDAADMWLSSMTGPQPTWIRYEFDRVYKLHQMWVWNYNTLFEPAVGFGIKDATIDYSTDGVVWTTLGTTHEFARAAATPGYAHNTTVDFGGALAKCVKITANRNWGVLSQYGLSEVRFLYVPVWPREPNPASGATNVSIGTLDEAIDVTLSWRAGREAAKHNVYFSESRQAVIDGTAPVTTVTEARYGPLSLGLAKTYYWRVDEVNEAEIPTTWQSELWGFTTQQYFLVDDFEQYNDTDNKIFDVWADYFVNNTGATVGYFDPPFAERRIVNSGSQSMPYRYDNDGTVNEGTAYEKTGTKFYSEAEREWAAPQDWTRRGVNTLTLHFQGALPAFAESAGTITMSAQGADIWGTADQFRYAYKQLNGDGQIVAKVVSIGGPGTNEWRKAGVMIRESLDAGSRHAFMAITPAVAHGVAFQNRPTVNGSSVNASQNVGFTTPCWVKLVRQGAQFTGYYSTNGINWIQVPTSTASDGSPNPQTIAMSPNTYIGLALTSHQSGVSCVAQFSDVTITGATGTWTIADIGVAQPSNDPAPMYVVLQDSANKTAVVKHTDPAATLLATWTQWNIPLTDFTGLNLRAIKKLSIGVGDRANPQRGGAGRLFIDDIQLRLPPLP